MLRAAFARSALARSRGAEACSAAAQRRAFATPGDFDLLADEAGAARVEGCARSMAARIALLRLRVRHATPRRRLRACRARGRGASSCEAVSKEAVA